MEDMIASVRLRVDRRCGESAVVGRRRQTANQPAGRWFEPSFPRASPEVARRIPDLAATGLNHGDGPFQDHPNHKSQISDPQRPLPVQRAVTAPTELLAARAFPSCRSFAPAFAPPTFPRLPTSMS